MCSVSYARVSKAPDHISYVGICAGIVKKEMKSLLYIFLFLLFISLHLNIGGWFIESQGLFYIASLGVLLLSAILMRKGFCIGKKECLISILCTYILIQMVVRNHKYG